MHHPDPNAAPSNSPPDADDAGAASRGAIDRSRPDQDGPHDVPDEQVIDKTLPSSTDRKDSTGERPDRAA